MVCRKTSFHPLLWTSSGLKGTWKLSAYISLVSLRCAVPSDLMKSTVVDESLSSYKPMYCSREYQTSTILFDFLYTSLREGVLRAKHVLTKGKLDKQPTGQSSSLYMSFKTSLPGKHKSVRFNTYKVLDN